MTLQVNPASGLERSVRDMEQSPPADLGHLQRWSSGTPAEGEEGGRGCHVTCYKRLLDYVSTRGICYRLRCSQLHIYLSLLKIYNDQYVRRYYLPRAVSMCMPHPAQVGLPHLEQVTRRHILYYSDQ